MKKFMKGVAKIRRGVGEFRKGGAEILWRELDNFLKGGVQQEGFFSDLFSG